jgi:iron complex transport system substrate-binding protein
MSAMPGSGRAVLCVVAGLLLSGALRDASSAEPREVLASSEPAEPQRVASINLSADEVLVAILPPGRLVSVTQWADAPGTSNVVGRVPPGVHRFVKADLEQLVALSPELVVVSEHTDADFLKQLERSGLRVHRMLGLGTLAGVRGAILDLGRAVGEQEAAGRLVADYDWKLAELSRRLAGAKRPRMLYWSGNMTAGASTAIGALIEAAGAMNVGRELGIAGIAPPGAERAFVTHPDLLLIGTWPGSKEALTSHPLFSRWAAVRAGRIVALRTELLVALSQYTADAAWELGHLVHPERVPASPGPRP